MANTVIALKKSSTPSALPTNLANGELAINFADGKLFYRHANGTILPFNTSGGNAFGTVNANGTLVVAGSSGAILTLIPGNNITITGDTINDTVTINSTVGSSDISAPFNQANTAYTVANLAFDKANSANLLAFNTGSGANSFTSATGGYYSGNYGVKAPDNYGDIFRIHSNTLTQNVTILSGNNAIAAGPITITGDSTTLTIQTGSRVVII